MKKATQRKLVENRARMSAGQTRRRAEKAANKPANKSTTITSSNDLIAGHYKPQSLDGKMLTLLSDGKARTPKEIVKAIGADSEKNMGRRYQLVSKFGKESKAFELSKTDDGKLQLTLNKKVSK